MRFTKMQGCGNDYVYIDCFAQKPPMQSRRAQRKKSPIGISASAAMG